MLTERIVVLVVTIIHTTTISTITVIDTILNQKKTDRITSVASNAMPVVKDTMIIMAAPMMASMFGNTRDTVQDEYDSNPPRQLPDSCCECEGKWPTKS